jgi:hypothetical protein
MRLVKPYLVFIVLILVNIGQAAAQEPETPEKEKLIRIGGGFGYSFLGYREETDLPLNRYLDTFNFNINGIVEKNNFYYSFNIGFLTGETKPLKIKDNDDYFSYYRIESTFIRFFFENALDYRLWGNSILPGYLGGAVRGDFYYSVLQQTNYYSLTMLCSLDLHVTQKWIINAGNEFAFSVSIPFFGYASRPPYYGLLYMPLDSDGRITSFHNYRAVFGDLKYYHQLNKLFTFYLGLGFELSLITFPQPRRDALFCMNTGITFSF